MIAFWSGRRWKLCKLWKIKETLHWCSANEHLLGAVRNCTHPELHETEPWCAAFTPTPMSPNNSVQCMLNWALQHQSLQVEVEGWKPQERKNGFGNFKYLWSYIIVFLNCHVNILQIISTCAWKAYSDFKKVSWEIFNSQGTSRIKHFKMGMRESFQRKIIHVKIRAFASFWNNKEARFFELRKNMQTFGVSW